MLPFFSVQGSGDTIRPRILHSVNAAEGDADDGAVRAEACAMRGAPVAAGGGGSDHHEAAWKLLLSGWTVILSEQPSQPRARMRPAALRARILALKWSARSCGKIRNDFVISLKYS